MTRDDDLDNPFDLAPDMLAFARYLRSAGALIRSDSITDIRDGTKALRRMTRRVLPDVHSVVEGTFRDMRFALYRASERAPAPVALYLHGGGWSHLDIEVYEPILRRLAVEGDMTVAAIDYPLAPEIGFPGNLQACTAFARWIRTEGPIPAGGISSFALMGDSAGANLAVGTAMMLRDAGEPVADRLGLIYGAFDLTREYDSYTRYGSGDLPLTADDIRKSNARYIPDPQSRSNPLVSPLFGDLAGLPPTFLSVAGCDPLYDANILMAARLGEAGVETTLKIYPKTIHGFLEAESVTGSTVATQAMREIARFVAGED